MIWTGVFIHPAAQIGPGVVIHTWFGVFVGTTKIGKNCTLASGVLISHATLSIGDNVRILRGESISAADYIDLLEARKSLIARAAARLAPYDALVMPTTANTPPKIADLADDKAFTRANLLALRNCTLINTIDGCAISLPCHREGEVPVGFMLASSGGADRRIFELAAGMEAAIRV